MWLLELGIIWKFLKKAIWSFPKSMLRRDMFLEGRLWHLGFETGQVRRGKLRRQTDDRHMGQKETGVFIT